MLSSISLGPSSDTWIYFSGVTRSVCVIGPDVDELDGDIRGTKVNGTIFEIAGGGCVWESIR